MSKEATKLALEALMHEMKYVLCCINLDIVPFDGDDFHEALRLGEEALVADLSAPKQEQGEPLCTAAMFDDAFLAKSGLSPDTKLYTTPQQPSTIIRTWVGLTDEEINDIWSDQKRTGESITKAIEAKLKEKNT
jgi:hypothetical protein